MQMLQQVFGADGARYVVWVLAAVALIVVALFLWWLIRKALGDRINMGDRTDRRGRPPRLGVTETFSIGPQGRRLVMVRRDNVEHLIMIGGPNDVVIETNVVRGERPVVGRPDPRQPEAEASASAEPLMPVRTALEPKVEARQETRIELKAQPAPAARPPEVLEAPVRPPEPPAPMRPAAPIPSDPAADNLRASLAERMKASLSRAPEPPRLPEPAVAAARQAAPEVPPPPPEPPKPSFAERLKSGLGRAPAPPAAAPPPPAPSPAPQSPDIAAPSKPAVPAPTPPPEAAAAKPEQSPIPSQADIRARLEQAVQGRMSPPPPVAAPAPPPPVAAPAPPPPAAAPAPPPAPGASRNPFDSLEEEMAKLLGRPPSGKG